jgi:hypothetical protein
MSFTQSCDQSITGRNLPFSRALEIVQNEEYLDEADLDIIRRRHDINIIEGIENFDKDLILQRDKRVPNETEELYPSNQEFNVAYYVGIIAASAVLTLVSLPAPPNTLPGQVPPGNPQPGTFGGGGLPTDLSNPYAGLAISLVPAGLLPVAVFPPFVKPRTIPAVAVIFSETPPGPGATAIGKRKKRWINRMFKARQGHYSDGRPSMMSRIARSLDRAVKTFQNRVRCLGPRLTRRFGRRVYNHALEQMGYYNQYDSFQRRSSGYYDYYDPEVNSLDDCFDDVSEPLYGFRVQVMLKEDEPCVLNETCLTSDGQLPTNVTLSSQEDDSSSFHSRQTGEEFSSDAPPDCRTSNSLG